MPWWGASNEYHNTFSSRNKKNYLPDTHSYLDLCIYTINEIPQPILCGEQRKYTCMFCFSYFLSKVTTCMNSGRFQLHLKMGNTVTFSFLSCCNAYASSLIGTNTCSYFSDAAWVKNSFWEKWRSSFQHFVIHHAYSHLLCIYLNIPSTRTIQDNNLNNSSFLTVTTPWANSADDKFMIFFFLFLQENRLKDFMQIVSSGDKRRQFAWNVKACFLAKIRKIFQNFVCWKFYLACWELKIFLRKFYISYCLDVNCRKQKTFHISTSLALSNYSLVKASNFINIAK